MFSYVSQGTNPDNPRPPIFSTFRQVNKIVNIDICSIYKHVKGAMGVFACHTPVLHYSKVGGPTPIWGAGIELDVL